MKCSDINYYLFSIVNISEDSGLNAEYENKLFKSHDTALEYMEKAIEAELSAYADNHYDMNELTIERIGTNMVNLWLTREHTEAVLYRISNIRPI